MLKASLSRKNKTRFGTAMQDLSFLEMLHTQVHLYRASYILWFTWQDYAARMQNSYSSTLFSAPPPLLSEIWENRRGEKTDSRSRELFALTPCPVTDKLGGGEGGEEGGGNKVLKLWVSYLNSLSSLLSICQELNGESPGILQGILEVDKAVTHMSPHGTFPTYGDRTGITVEMQYLEGKTEIFLTT